jgi:hypothetical protein
MFIPEQYAPCPGMNQVTRSRAKHSIVIRSKITSAERLRASKGHSYSPLTSPRPLARPPLSHKEREIPIWIPPLLSVGRRIEVVGGPEGRGMRSKRHNHNDSSP